MTALNGRKVLVAGGYGAIGAVICEQLLEQGASVAIAGRSVDKATALASKLSAGDRQVIGKELDITSSDGIQRSVHEVAEELSGIDTLINCASKLDTIPAENFPEEGFRDIIDANLTGAFLLSREVGKLMIDSGENGRLLHLSSVRGAAGARRGFSAYGASKAGLDLLVKQLATEWGQHGITVNAVAPGFMLTDFVEQATQDEQFLRMLKQRIPLGRFAEPEEVSSAVLYLISPLARFISGQILYVDGGVTASQ